MDEKLKNTLDYLLERLKKYGSDSVLYKIYFCSGFLEKDYPEISKLLEEIVKIG